MRTGGLKRKFVLGVSGVLGLTAFVLSAGSALAQSSSSSQSGAVAGASSRSLAGAASINGGNKQQIDFNSPSNQTIKNVPNVYAPGLAVGGAEVCLGSMSAGGAGAGFGLTIAGSIVDRECQLRLNARTLAVLGYAVAARETMCLDPDVRRAMIAAGTPCAADRYVANTALNSMAAAIPEEPVHVVSTSENVYANDSTPRCRKEYQLIGGWYELCNY